MNALMALLFVAVLTIAAASALLAAAPQALLDWFEDRRLVREEVRERLNSNPEGGA
ncbi:hypothetical protein RN51_01650 [Microbacterium oxydans]|uniref:Uncharacterized protein n=1 Tax=Microbacterium oxydans TaxID=82380 RepID=A0A0F0KS09_9MICO|nr:hypothetical protein [Microbacterium oxydans]KJL22905.1 hypothetical protein RN51_01650 [Microbacterium oxydans]